MVWRIEKSEKMKQLEQVGQTKGEKSKKIELNGIVRMGGANGGQ